MNFKIKISDMAQILTSINRSEVFLYLRNEIIIHINKTGITLYLFINSLFKLNKKISFKIHVPQYYFSDDLSACVLENININTC